jgi:tetratricopeptide (TPR) repeat protein
MGKTTLALSVLHADSVKQRYPRRFFVSCEAVTSVNLLLSEIADVLHIPASKRDAALYDTILHFLSEEQRTLVCFDNFETPWAVAESHQKFEEVLEQLDKIPTLSILVTMRGTQRPSSIQWSRPLFTPLSALSFDHMKEIYTNIAEQCDTFAELLLREVGGVPLAATLLAWQVQDGQSSKLLWKRWEREKTSIFETGRRDRLSSLDISIQLSIDSPLLKNVPYAVQILSMMSFLPTGLPEDSPLMDSLEKNLPENLNLYHAIQALQRVALVYLDQDSSTHRFRILPPIRQYCLTRLSSEPELKNVLSLTYVHFINNNRNYAEPLLQNIVPPELMNLHHILFAMFKDKYINNTGVFDAAANYTNWSRYLGLNIDTIIKLAIERGDREDSALIGSLYQTYGELCFRFDRLDDARATLGEALTLHRKCGTLVDSEGNVLRLLGHLYLQQGELDIAEHHLGQALELHQKCGALHNTGNDLRLLGDLYLQRGELDKAEHHLGQALQLHRKCGSLLHEGNDLRLLGDLYLRQGELDKAEHHLGQALQLHQKCGTLLTEGSDLRLLGELYLQQGELAKAKHHVGQALELHRKCGSLLGEGSDLRLLGELYLRQGELDKAEHHLGQALELHRKCGSLLIEGNDLQLLGELYLQQGELDKAEHHVGQAFELHRKCGSLLGEGNDLRLLGDLYLRQGELDKAEHHLSQALELHQKCGAPLSKRLSLRLLGRVYMLLQKLDLAEDYSRKATEINIQIKDFYWAARELHDLGCSFLGQGLPVKSAEAFSQAIDLYRDAEDREGEADCLYNHACSLERLGQSDKARQSLELSLVICREAGYQKLERLNVDLLERISNHSEVEEVI